MSDQFREALEFVTRVVDSSGCPGEERWGVGHKDIIHVAPYHCEKDGGCPICAALDAAPAGLDVRLAAFIDSALDRYIPAHHPDLAQAIAEHVASLASEKETGMTGPHRGVDDPDHRAAQPKETP